MPSQGSTHRPRFPQPGGDAALPVNGQDVVPEVTVSPSSGRVVLSVSETPHAHLDSNEKTVISNRPPLAEGPLPIISSAQHLGQMLAGKRLEHYELDQFVGGGGMGAVFRATDTRLGRTVAVKVLSRDHTDEETIRRFQNEAQSAARLDHPNIARVYYVGEDHGWNFIVFEYIEGQNLRDIVQERGPLDLEEALDYALHVAEALAHAAGRDVVHRDIKPSNVLVMAGGQVKLVDMGLARLHQVESSSDDLTASGVTLGTFDYISPEQARDPRSADVRSDIYSLGCTLFYMLTGRPPFPDGTALQKLLRHNADEPPDVRQFRPEISPRVTALLNKMLAKRPSQRQQTGQELVAEIVAIGQQLELPRIVQHGQVVLAAPSARGPWWATLWQIASAVAVLVAAIVLLDAWLAATRPQQEVILRPQNLRPPDPVSLHAEPPEVATSAVKPLVSPPATASQATSSLPSGAAPSPAAKGSNVSTAMAPMPSAAGSSAVTQASEDAVPSLAEAPSFSTLGVSLPAFSGGLGPEPIEAKIEDVALNGQPEASDLPQPARVVVLGTNPAPPDPEVVYVASLADGLRRAAALDLDEVELRFNGRHVEKPFDITLPRLAVRAASGYQPVVVFQPVTGLDRKEMIKLAGGPLARLSVQGIELRMELAADAPAAGWSLISLSTGQTLELTTSVLTVQDGDATSPPLHDQVAMIAVQARSATDGMTMMDPQAGMGQKAAVALERVVARGAATFLSMAEETPLTLKWNQGLLVTPRRMFETGGSDASAKWYDDISLTLERLTASCGEGLYRMQMRPSAADHFKVNVLADHCVLIPPARVPLFEFIGVSALGQDELHVQGDSNCFPSDALFLRTQSSSSSGGNVQEFDLNGHVSSDEVSPKPGNPWKNSPPLGRPPHELTPADFLVIEMADAGFDIALLPDVLANAAQQLPPEEAAADPTMRDMIDRARQSGLESD